MRTLKRSKNLEDGDLKVIVEILDGWSGALTWDLLIAEVYARLHFRYSRQALHKHLRIRTAFEQRKQNLRAGGAVSQGSVQVQKALERISRLEAENQRLQFENERLLEQFARWAYNSYAHGFSEEELNRPLPPINRRQTPVSIESVPRKARKS